MPKKQRRKKHTFDPNQLSLLDYATVSPMSGGANATKDPAQSRKRRETKTLPAGAPSVLTAQQAAHYLNLSIATLKSWRAKKTGPAFVKRGARLIGYLPADLDAYLKNLR